MLIQAKKKKTTLKCFHILPKLVIPVIIQRSGRLAVAQHILAKCQVASLRVLFQGHPASCPAKHVQAKHDGHCLQVRGWIRQDLFKIFSAARNNLKCCTGKAILIQKKVDSYSLVCQRVLIILLECVVQYSTAY